MLTIFTTAKPFEGHSGMIQRNALKSWTLLHPDIEVILFGDEKGTAEVCAEFGLRHEPRVERHKSGLKYLSYMFARAQDIARHDYLCYSNCDIVFFTDFRDAFEKVVAWRRRFLTVGQRRDTDVTEPIDFEREDWAANLRRLALTAGRLQIPEYVDFFVFPKGLYDLVPPLIVGRSFWDHWLVWKALAEGAPVIDCTPFVLAVHQNHGYGYHTQGKQGTNQDALAKRNIELSGDGRHLRCIIDATHKLGYRGEIRWTPFRRQLTRYSPRNMRQSFAEDTFPLRRRLGLRRRTFEKILGRSNSLPDQTDER
jgi:hypothetical protein